jgi:predicted GIY-YIG superfamily endonuclease
MGESKGWSCYILECADHSYYVGVATDVQQREHDHNAGRGAKHTRLRRPVRLVWSQACPSYAEARALEGRLKGWSRKKKMLLITGSLRLG